MENVFLFTGDNAYALRREHERWIYNFIHKHGEYNLLRIEGKTLKTADLCDEIRTIPFIGDHRLVVIDEIPKWTKEEMSSFLESLHPQTILLFKSAKPDRRQGSVKVILKKAVIKSFPCLTNVAIRQWISDILASEKATMTSNAKNMLLERIGEDQDMMEMELNKLMIFADGREITDVDINILVPPSREWVIWNLTDYLSQRRRSDTLLYADTLLRSGQDPMGLWSVLCWMVRSLVMTAGAVEEDQNPSYVDGIHPRTLRNLIALVHSLTTAQLLSIVEDTVRFDKGLKVGEYRSTVDEPQEVIALIDRLILRCT